jgi:hypothetical protein
MSPKAAPSKRSAEPPRKARAALPAALAERASALATRKEVNDRAEATSLVAEVKRRMSRIAEDFYDMGRELSKLRDPRLYRALGRSSFAQLVEEDVGISGSQAYKLVAIAEQLPRERALALGTEKASALVQLARATPALDTAETLATGKVKLPGRREPVALAEVSADEIARAARAQRDKTGGAAAAAQREAERVVKRCEAALHEAGLERARVGFVLRRVKGSAPAAELVLRGVDVAQLKKLARALARIE